GSGRMNPAGAHWAGERMSGRSRHRFAGKDMRQPTNLEHVPIPQESDVVEERRAIRPGTIVRIAAESIAVLAIWYACLMLGVGVPFLIIKDGVSAAADAIVFSGLGLLVGPFLGIAIVKWFRRRRNDA